MESSGDEFEKNPCTREASFRELAFSPSSFSFPTITITPPLPHQLHLPYHSPILNMNKFKSLSSHKCISSRHKNDGRLRSIAIIGRLVYTSTDNGTGTIRIWKLPELSEYGQLKSKSGLVKAIAVSGEHLFAACNNAKKIRVWCRSWDLLPKHVHIGSIPKFRDRFRGYIGRNDLNLMDHLGAITSLGINVSDDLLYSASIEATVKVWRISDLRCTETIQAHSGPINAMIVGDDGMLYTASDDATVKVWRRIMSGGDQPHSLIIALPTTSSPVHALSLTPDGQTLYGGCANGYVHFWLKGCLSGHLQYGGALLGHQQAVTCLACMSNDNVASGSADWTCRVWAREGVDRHTCVAVLEGHRGPITCVAAFSIGGSDDGEDGYTLCTGSVDGTVKVWRVSNCGIVGHDPA